MKDIHYKREAQKYDNPIPSREHILSFIQERQLSYKQLLKILKLQESQFKPLKKRLRAMVRDKELSCSKNGMYRTFSNRGLYIGEVIANPKGFGFVKLDNGGKDLRLSSQQMKYCLNGDTVKVRLLNDKLEAEIVQVLSMQKNLVGRLEIINDNTIAIIDDKYIHHNVQIDSSGNSYKENDVVLIDIVKNPTQKSMALGVITTKIGSVNDANLETKSAIFKFNIPHIFSREVLAELENISDEVESKDLQGRVDYTHLDFVTIDGDTSQDFDDALYAKEVGNGYDLYVAIADVGHYVNLDSKLDENAKERGNSVYFPRSVVPMLPEKLSNHLCSLNQQETRLALVCKMHINALGEVEHYTFENAYICSKQRLTYNVVNTYLDGKKKIITSTAVKRNIETLYQVYKLLKLNRQKIGLIEFERAESRIVFNDKGKIKKIDSYIRGESHKIVEECMLIANKSAGDFLTSHQADFLYRSHPKPSIEKIFTMKAFLKTFGLKLDGDNDPTAKDFAKVLQASRHKPEHNVIKTLMLRSMSQAVYTSDNPYHFGLAFENYTHFTSPIRRYADLIAHRAIKQVIKGKTNTITDLDMIAKHVSITERRADEATRDSERSLKCEYMTTKVGQEFTGTISGVQSFGLFVEINDLLVDGLVKIESLSGYFLYDVKSISLTLKDGTRSYKLGDQVEVIIASVNIERREINLIISE